MFLSKRHEFAYHIKNSMNTIKSIIVLKIKTKINETQLKKHKNNSKL